MVRGYEPPPPLPFAKPCCRLLYAVLSLLLYITMKIAVALLSGAVVFRTILGWDLYPSSVVLIALTGNGGGGLHTKPAFARSCGPCTRVCACGWVGLLISAKNVRTS